MADDTQGERTLEPTDQRREEFKKQGRYARAKDLGGLVATACVAGGLLSARRDLATATQRLFTRSLGDLDGVDHDGLARAVTSCAGPLVAVLVPIVLGAAVVAAIASAAQVRFRLNTDAISPRFDRLDPKNAFERLFSFKKNLAELGISLVRVGAIGTVAWVAVARELPVLVAAARAPVAASSEVALGAIGHVVLAVLVASFVVAGADYAHAWFALEREMKMTWQERMEEARREDGDPKQKGRMKARARALAKKRNLDGVKAADVIVTNPTHFSVALRYGDRDPAPVVVAKGVDELALRIRAEARKHGIPILENRPLARALYAEVQIGRVVPQAHFAAVAQVLAFVYRLKKRGAFRGTRSA